MLLTRLPLRRGDAACVPLSISAVTDSRSLFSSPSCCFPSLVLLRSALRYSCLLRRLLPPPLPQTLAEEEAGDGLLNGSLVSGNVR